MMYGDPAFEGKHRWLTFGTAAIPKWRYFECTRVYIMDCASSDICCDTEAKPVDTTNGMFMNRWKSTWMGL